MRPKLLLLNFLSYKYKDIKYGIIYGRDNLISDRIVSNIMSKYLKINDKSNLSDGFM